MGGGASAAGVGGRGAPSLKSGGGEASGGGALVSVTGRRGASAPRRSRVPPPSSSRGWIQRGGRAPRRSGQGGVRGRRPVGRRRGYGQEGQLPAPPEIDPAGAIVVVEERHGPPRGGGRLEREHAVGLPAARRGGRRGRGALEGQHRAGEVGEQDAPGAVRSRILVVLDHPRHGAPRRGWSGRLPPGLAGFTAGDGRDLVVVVVLQHGRRERGRRRGCGRGGRRRHHLGPRDGLPWQREPGLDPHALGRLLQHEAAAPDHGAHLLVGVDHQHVGRELDGRGRSALRKAPGLGARPRQARTGTRRGGVEAVEHDPLVPAEVLHLLVGGRGVVGAEVDAVGDLDERGRRAEGLGRRPLAEEPPAGLKVRRDGAEARRAARVGRVDEVRLPAPVPLVEADALGVVGVAGPAEGAVPPERHALERLRGDARRRAVAEDVDRLVEEGVLPVDPEPRGHRGRRPAPGRVGVAGEDDTRAGQVGRGLGGLVSAPVLAHDVARGEQPRHPVEHEAEGRLDHHGGPDHTAHAPHDGAHGDGAAGSDRDGPGRDHGRSL